MVVLTWEREGDSLVCTCMEACCRCSCDGIDEKKKTTTKKKKGKKHLVHDNPASSSYSPTKCQIPHIETPKAETSPVFYTCIHSALPYATKAVGWRVPIGCDPCGTRPFANVVFSRLDDCMPAPQRLTCFSTSLYTAHRVPPRATIGRFLRGFGGAKAPVRFLAACARQAAKMANVMPDKVEDGGGQGELPRKRVKLHGRAFYESIGSPKIVLAPMVEQSEFVRPSRPSHSSAMPTDDS